MESKKAVTFRLVFEGGKPFVVIGHGGTEDFVRYALNLSQVSSFVKDSIERVLVR